MTATFPTPHSTALPDAPSAADPEPTRGSVNPGNPVPLCVDLDGTLLKSDTLHDSILILLRTRPAALLTALRLLPRGKAAFKQHIAQHLPLDPRHLPWNRAVLRVLRKERASGRTVILATGADRAVAARIAQHLGCFDQVLASDGHLNLTGARKLAILSALFPSFDYIGNARADLPLLMHAREAILANPTPSLLAALRHHHVHTAATLTDRTPLRASLPAALRLHQWTKNLLLLLPLLLAHQIAPRHALTALLAVLAFGCAASVGYVVNDLLDIDHDRSHLRKRTRPFASGDLSLPQGLLLAATLLLAAALLLPLLPAAFAAWLAMYIAATSLYSLWLKRIPIADVLLLAALYTLRIYAGGAATRIAISPWLCAFAIFFFLALALVKRLNELETLRQQRAATPPGRGYRVDDIGLIRSLTTGSACASLAVFALYVAHPDATLLYHHPERLWLVLAPLAFWLLRMGMLASRGQLHDDPVLFALRDRVSLLAGALITALAFAATL